jgi:2-polyprenyl-3-methyl-5-hydroxy-6-metoxy-1,4-benzoquinol methylase
MANTNRVDTALFQGDHYLGKPADFSDRIISRRTNLCLNQSDFVGKDLDLVEIGCGNGASMVLLSPHFRSIDGLEYFEGHRKEFEELKDKYQSNNLSFYTVDIENSKPARQYDRMISFEVYEHLQHESSIKYYFDILKPGGLAAITVPNKWWIFETHGAKLPLLPWNRVPFFSWLPTFLHERWANARIYTKKRITRILTEAGFEVIDVAYITAPMDVLKDGFLKRWLLKHIFNTPTTSNPFKSTSIFIAVRKPG